MKSQTLVKPALILLLFIFCFAQCKKKVEEGGNIRLKDKPLSVIKAHIQGKWQLHYSHGGITGRIHQNHINSFIEFKQNDSIYWNDNSNLIVSDKITWHHMRDIFNDITYMMSFCEMRGPVCYPYSWLALEVRNDTLVFFDNANDGMGYYLTKIK